MAVERRSYRTKIVWPARLRHIWIQLRIVSFIVIPLIHGAVSQTVLTSDVPTDPICPNAPVVFTCTVEGAGVLRWIVTNGTDILLIQYTGSTLSLDTTRPGIETELTSAQPGVGVNFDYRSTLSVSAALVLGNINTVVCDGGNAATEMRQTVELRSPPTAPQFTCTLPGEGILRLNWNDTGDAVTEYRVCDCTSPGCSCVPMRCGTTSVCDTNLAAGQEQTFSFTALNCGNSQESSVSTLTTAGADAPAAPVLSEVRVRYDQSSGGLRNIMATWNRMTPSDVVMGCTDEIGVQYTITCGGSSPVDVNTNCDSSSCSYERSTSSGCTLSVAVSDAVGTTASDTSIIQDQTPLTLEVSDGTITCRDFSSCVIVYGTDPSNRNLTAVSGQRIPGLLPDETYFYLVTQTLNSQVVEVEGSFLSACDCLDLIDRQLFNPLPVCSGGGGTIPGAISNGGVTYTSLAINSGRAIYQCDERFSISDENPRECQGDGRWSGTPPTCQLQEAKLACSGLSVGATVGITFALTFLVSFSAGLLVAFVIAYCYIRRLKGQYSPRNTQQPAPMYEEVATHVQPGNMEMKENVAYGPITH